jgi:hypothetical protein
MGENSPNLVTLMPARNVCRKYRIVDRFLGLDTLVGSFFDKQGSTKL